MFEQRLLEARKKKGLTQKQLSDAAGIHPASYSAYETNRKVPPVDILMKIADVLEVSVDWLCGREKEEKYTTYGSVARAIYAIQNVLDETAGSQCNIRSYTTNSLEIDIIDSTLQAFFSKSEKFREMANDSEDAKELYNAWMETKFKELDKQYLDLLPF